MVKADVVTSEGLRHWQSGCWSKWKNSSAPPIWLLVSLVLINTGMSHWVSGFNSSCQSLGQSSRGWWVRGREPYPAENVRRLGWEQRLTGVHWWWALCLSRVNRNSLLDMDLSTHTRSHTGPLNQSSSNQHVTEPYRRPVVSINFTASQSVTAAHAAAHQTPSPTPSRLHVSF